MKERKNQLKLLKKNNQILVNKNSQIDEEIELKDFYDVIINIKSVKDISDGWDIIMTQKGEENYNKYRNEELIKIGVIGNSNKGKSFIFSKISKIKLPSGTSIKTMGLSIKYPELEKFKMRKIALLDSAGLETPVLKEEISIREEDDNKENEETKNFNINNNENKDNNKNEDLNKEKIENEKKNIINKNANIENGKLENLKDNDINDKKENNKNGNENEIFKRKSREKLITELFL